MQRLYGAGKWRREHRDGRDSRDVQDTFADLCGSTRFWGAGGLLEDGFRRPPYVVDEVE